MTLQEDIINELGTKPTIDPKEEIRKSVEFLKAYLKKYPFLKTFVNTKTQFFAKTFSTLKLKYNYFTKKLYNNIVFL